MKKIVFLFSLLLLLVGCSKSDPVSKLVEIYGQGTEEVKAAKDLEAFKAATAKVVAETEALKKEVSAAEFERAEKDKKVEAAAADFGKECLAKAAGLGADAVEELFNINASNVSKIIDSTADLLKEGSENLPDAMEEFDKALDDAAKAFEESLNANKKEEKK